MQHLVARAWAGCFALDLLDGQGVRTPLRVVERVGDVGEDVLDVRVDDHVADDLHRPNGAGAGRVRRPSAAAALPPPSHARYGATVEFTPAWSEGQRPDGVRLSGSVP